MNKNVNGEIPVGSLVTTGYQLQPGDKITIAGLKVTRKGKITTHKNAKQSAVFEKVFYASANKGTIKGVEKKKKK